MIVNSMLIRTFLAFAVVFLFSFSQSIYAASIAVDSSCSLTDAITAANTDTATGGCAAGSGIFSSNILCMSFFC